MKLPYKILTFIWKILHGSLPIFEILNTKGMRISNLCLMCNKEEESIDHLFLHCLFARAIWHGSNLEVRTLDLVHNSIDFWLTSSILHNANRNNDRIFFLQSLCTILWAIWNHRNKVLHQGKSPNPMKVMPTAQSLACRYRKAFQKDQPQHPKFLNHLHQIRDGNFCLTHEYSARPDPNEPAFTWSDKE